MPCMINLPIAVSALLVWPLESSCANIPIFDRVIIHLPWSTSTLLDVRVAASHIEYVSLSTAKLPSEIDEYMQVNSSISVKLSSHDAFSVKRRDMVANLKRVERTALGIGEEESSDILDDELSHK